VSERREDAKRLSALARLPAQQARRLIGRLLDRHHEAVALFCGADGEPTAAAAAWFARLARENFVEGSTHVPGDRDAMLFNEGRRTLALEILASVRIDRARLAQLKAQTREGDDG
jgi:hypothetical protein